VAVDGGPDAVGADGGVAGGAEEAGDGVEEEEEDGVAGGFGEGAVEEEVGVDAELEGPEDGERGEGRLEGLDLRGGAAFGGEGGDFGFEGAADFEEVGEGAVAAAEHGVEGAEGRLGAGGADADAAALGDVEEALGFEVLHGFAEDVF